MTESLGHVCLVGAGPGDPGLITVAGLQALRRAEVVVFDRLAPRELLAEAAGDSLLIDVGKKAGAHSKTQDEINDLLVEHGRAGRRVVRLKGGDPFVFGRGGEEALALAAANVPVTVIPGITSAIAGPALAGIPVTHRGASASFAVLSGRSETGDPTADGHWRGVARSAGTVVVLMGATRIAEVAAAMVEAGRDESTPAALVERATQPGQRVIKSTLGSIAVDARAARVVSPATLVVGDTVSLAQGISLGGTPGPFSGQRVAITGAADGGPRLEEQLRAAGAEPVSLPLARAVAIDPGPALDNALARLADGEYRWLAFSSARGVEEWFSRLTDAGLDARALASVKVCAVGPVTAQALLNFGIRADLVPPKFTGADAALAIAREEPKVSSARVLLPRAQKGADSLPVGLRELGAAVDELHLYTMEPMQIHPAQIEILLSCPLDAVTLASPSIAFAWGRLAEGPLAETAGIPAMCIGPTTADAAREAGLSHVLVSEEHTGLGMVEALGTYFQSTEEGSSR